MSEQTSPSACTDHFHLARSKCLDAFVNAEMAVTALLVRSNTKFGGEFLGRKIEILRKAKPAPQYSKVKRDAVLPLLDELETLLPIRADFVHGILKIAIIDEEALASFVNVRNTNGNTHLARHITRSQFEALTRQVAKLGQNLALP